MKGHNYGLCRKCGKMHIKPKKPRETRFCECKCGGTFECRAKSKKRFLKGHQNRGRKLWYGKINNFSKPHIILKIKNTHKKEVLCKNCGAVFITYQGNPNNIPKYCKNCIDFGGKCIICNKDIKLSSRFCKKHQYINAGFKTKNPMKNKEYVKKGLETRRKNGVYSNGGGFGRQWREEREKMLFAIRDFQANDTEYRKKCSQIAINRIQNGDYFNKIGINGWYYSNKNSKNLYYMSLYELAAFQILEAMITVKRYTIQAFVIPYIFENRKHNYIVDLFVEYTDGQKQLIEVASIERLDDRKLTKINAGKEFAKEHNYDFVVWTEKELGMTKEKRNALYKSRESQKNNWW